MKTKIVYRNIENRPKHSAFPLVNEFRCAIMKPTYQTAHGLMI